MAIVAKSKFVEVLRSRTKKFSIEAVSIFRKLPPTEEAKIIGRQFLRSALSVGSNYHAVCRARSRNEFFSKLSITVEEADETFFWTEIMTEAKLIAPEDINSFQMEASEIIRILSKARKTTSM